MSKRWTTAAMVFLLISFFSLLGLNSAWGAEKAKVKFAVDWVIYGAFAPWFVALDKGFYSAEGLEVDISRGFGAGADQIKRLESGERDIVFVDPMAVVLGRAKGTRVKVVAAIYEKAPMSIFSLNKTGIKGLKDLEGRSLGLSPGGVEQVLVPAGFKINKLDFAKVNVVSIDPAQKIPMLVAGKVDAITWYITGIPLVEKGTAELGGYDIIVLADHGLDLYSNSIGTTDDYLAKNGEVVRRFVRASIKGWERAKSQPAEAVESLLKYYPALDKELTAKMVDAVLRLAFTESARKYGVGYMTEEKMKRTVDLTVRLYEIKEPVKPTDIYTNSFLK